MNQQVAHNFKMKPQKAYHNLCKEENNEIRWFGAWEHIEELREGYQQTTDRCDSDYTHQQKWHMLRPEANLQWRHEN